MEQEITIGEVEKWLDKLSHLDSKGAKIVHVKNLLKSFRRDETSRLITKYQHDPKFFALCNNLYYALQTHGEEIYSALKVAELKKEATKYYRRGLSFEQVRVDGLAELTPEMREILDKFGRKEK